MIWFLKVLVLVSQFLSITTRFNRRNFNSVDEDIRRLGGVEEDPLCTECCEPGKYNHGNEKCGLAVHAHTFAYELMRSIAGGAHNPENVVISPFSVMNIMMLLSLGASGRTREEIRRTLQFPMYFAPEHDHILMRCALKKYDGVSLHAANAVFYDSHKATAKESFLEEAEKYYNVSVNGVEFQADPYHAWLNVSEFIRESSNGFLDQVLQGQEASISELLFVNTVYFNGTWNFAVPSDGQKKITFLRNFRTAETVEAFEVTSVLNVGVMEDYTSYGDRIRVVELPYSDTQFSMFIFKSDKRLLSLNFIEETISRWTIGAIKQYKMAPDMITVTIPKFSITYQADISDALVKMGIKELFSRGRNPEPELGNLFENEPQISADRLLHSAKIMVTEAGTEAASASIATISRMGYWAEKITFAHPFVFVIYDSCNNLILFQGRCVDPRS